MTVNSLQYPVDGDYHKLSLSVNISKFECGKCHTTTGPFNNLTVTFSSKSDEYFCHSYNYTGNTGNKIMKLISSVQK